MTTRRINALVQDDRVHRDVYLSEEIFALEQQHFFANTWNFVGHASQLPNPGDFLTVDIAGRPLLALRQADGAIHVLYNRCAHKGSKLLTDACGNVGPVLRCPYHAWSYRLDGTPLTVPLKSGYDGTQWRQCQSVLRNIIHCNWKMYLENINDSVHPMSTHVSATQAAQAMSKGPSADTPKPMALEQLLPFGAGYAFFDNMGGRVMPNGHSVLGTQFSIHSAYGGLPDYEAAMQAAHGVEKAKEILYHSPQNAVCFPSLSVKGSPQVMRVIRPLAANRTLIEAWSLRALGAPDLLFERSMTYNRLVFSPMSMVAHDDIHLFESMQQGLRADGNEWVSLHRGFDAAERDTPTRDVNGTNEILIRNQHRAWAKFMTLDMKD